MHIFKDFDIISNIDLTIYRASQIILDHLQDLTLKYAHNNQKCFLQAHFYIRLTQFFKMIRSS